jgi:hypothetical protein
MIYQIIAKPMDTEVAEDDFAQTYISEFNEKKGYNFLDKERFSTDLADTKFRYMSTDEVVQLKLNISNFNSTIGEDVIELIELI